MSGGAHRCGGSEREARGSRARRASSATFLVALLVTLLLLRPSPRLLAGGPGETSRDGPPIGVLLYENPSALEIACGASDRLYVEGQFEHELLPAGAHRLEIRGDVVRIGDFHVRGRPIRFSGATRQLTRVEDTVYEGWIEVLPPEKGHGWRVVNRLPLERYLVGVVAGEMPTGSETRRGFPPAALEAQAIASRTYALHKILLAKPDERVHVRRDVRSQVYDAESADLVAHDAVYNTRGQVLTYENRVFEAFFHSTCGGATASAVAVFGGPDIPPLSGVVCGYCQDSPVWRWKASLPAAAIERLLRPICASHGVRLGSLIAIVGLKRGKGGHAAWVRIEHSGGSFEMDATLFRTTLIAGGLGKLRSTAFECHRDGDDFVFEGRGWGHGVGMCQWGARGMAAQGFDARTIVLHYYPGSELVKLW